MVLSKYPRHLNIGIISKIYIQKIIKSFYSKGLINRHESIDCFKGNIKAPISELHLYQLYMQYF